MAKSLLLASIAALALAVCAVGLAQAAAIPNDGHTGLTISVAPNGSQSLMPGDVQRVQVKINVTGASVFALHAQLSGEASPDAVMATTRDASGAPTYQGRLADLIVRGQVMPDVPAVVDVELSLALTTSNDAAAQTFHVVWVVTAQLAI